MLRGLSVSWFLGFKVNWVLVFFRFMVSWFLFLGFFVSKVLGFKVSKFFQRFTKSEVGGCSTGKSFRFVRACVRAVWLRSGIAGRPFPFSLLAGLGRGAFPLLARVVPGSFPFSLLGPGAFPFPFPHPPNLLSNFS